MTNNASKNDLRFIAASNINNINPGTRTRTTMNAAVGVDPVAGIIDSWANKNENSPGKRQNEEDESRDLVSSMENLTVNSTPKADSTVPERRWAGPRPTSYASNRTSYQRSRIGSTFAGDRGFKPTSMEAASIHQIMRFPKEEFKVGKIIRAPVHEEHDKGNVDGPSTSATTQASIAPDSTMTVASCFPKKHESMTPHGPVYSEYRYLIIVGLNEDTYVVVPLYTYQGTGLQYKRGHKEYVSLADHRYPGQCESQNDIEPLKTAVLKTGQKPMHPKSIAPFAYPISRHYKWPIAHAGKLNDQETQRLVSLWSNHTRRAITSK